MAELSREKLLEWLRTTRERTDHARTLVGHGGQDFWDGINWADSGLAGKIEDGDFDV